MKSLLLAISFLILGASSVLHAQGVQADLTREVNFLYEVKVIDEFIERFNDDPTSFLRKEYLRHGKPINFTRRDLVQYLFEKPAGSGDSLMIGFVNQVTDSLHPQKLSFDDTNWYAEVMCNFSMAGKHMNIPLVLQVATDTDRSSRWMICGIGDAPVFHDGENAAAPAAVKDQKKFISPSDYATNFLELHHILKPGFEGVNYLTPQLMESERGRKFARLIQDGKMKFEAPGAMRFYFFQIPNYTFVVERFVRQTTHSGWLISDLTPASADEKRIRKEKLLQSTL
jgi:hypothetical protein